jgi:hypothetical protein
MLRVFLILSLVDNNNALDTLLNLFNQQDNEKKTWNTTDIQNAIQMNYALDVFDMDQSLL